MFQRIDHLVILVRRLGDAIAAYRELGFQVVPGGEHPDGTHNALIGFADGTYLELIAFQAERPHDHRWHEFLATDGGLIDVCLGADDVEAILEEVRARGLGYRGPVPGARTRPDGMQISWRLGLQPEGRTGELPFFIEDLTPRELRVPSGDRATHANGVIGVRAVVVAVRNLAGAADLYGKLLGTQAPTHVADEIVYMVGTGTRQQEIRLAHSGDSDSPLAQRVQRQGGGPYEVLLLADSTTEAHTIEAPTQAGGVRFLIQPVR